MDLIFEKVYSNQVMKINEVYEIIKDSGEHMYKKQGLVHWKSPYPIEAIKKNCKEREVFLVKNLDTNTYVHTFQLEFISKLIGETRVYNAIINKFATIPKLSGKGIGKLSMNYIEELCRNKGISKIRLEVYDRSEHAVQFYKKRGFSIAGSKPTRHFTVQLMEKQL